MNHVFCWDIRNYLSLVLGNYLQNNDVPCFLTTIKPPKKIVLGAKKNVGAHEESVKNTFIEEKTFSR